MAPLTVSDYEAYINLLTGYDLTPSDDLLIQAIAEGERQHMLNAICGDVLPEGLETALRDMVAGKFLQTNKSAIIGSDNLQVVKSLTEGDVSITLGGSTAESRIDEIIDMLTRERDLKCFRKFRW